MATVQDTFIDESRLRETLASETVGGSPVSDNVLSFNGSSDHITISDNDIFSFTDGDDLPFSVGAWVYIEDSQYFSIITKFGSASTDDLEWAFWTGFNRNLIFEMRNPGNINSISRTSTISMADYEGQWVHVMGTYDGSETSAGISLYLNGQPLAGSAGAASYSTMGNTSSPVYIGRATVASTYYADGKIADAVIYSSELTSQEVNDIYTTNEYPTGSLVGLWRINEGDGTTITDSSGNGNDGTLTGGVWGEAFLLNEDIQSGNALEFNGTTSYVDCGQPSVFDITGDLTVMAWIKLDSFPGSVGNVIAKWSSDTNDKCYRIYVTSGGACYFRLSNDGSTNSNIGNIGTLELGKWYHVVGVHDAASDRMYSYLNGELNSDVAHTGDIYSASTQNLYIGAENESNIQNFLDGKITHAAIFDTALSHEQIERIYKSNVYPVPGRVSLFPLDEGSGATANDSWDTINGTISNGSWGSDEILTQLSRTTTTNKLSAADTFSDVTDFKYTTGKKPGNTFSRLGFSQDYDEDREAILSLKTSIAYANVMQGAGTLYPTPGSGMTYTIGGWYRCFDISAQGAILASGWNTVGNATGKLFDFMVLGDNSLRMRHSASEASGGGEESLLAANAKVLEGVWHHIIFTFNETTKAYVFYVDGVNVGSGTGTITPDAENNNTTARYINRRGSTYTDLDVADFRIYDRVLSSSEVLDWYKNESVSDTSLRVWYKFDETDYGTAVATDSSSGGLDGTMTDPFWSRDDKDLAQKFATWTNANNDEVRTGGYSFDGIDDAIDLSTAPSLVGTAGTWSIWMRHSSPTDLEVFINSGNLTTDNRISLRISSTGTVEFLGRVNGTSSVVLNTDNKAFIDDEWTHVALVQDGTEPKIYINGVYVPQTFSISSNKTIWYATFGGTLNTFDLGVANYNNNPTFRPFEGDLSDFQVYNAALSEEEIWDIYANNKPKVSNRVSRYLLNGNALDSWSSNDGIVDGAIPLGGEAQTPIVGQATTPRLVPFFDGVDDYINVPDDATIQNIWSGGGTLSFWLKHDFTVGTRTFSKTTLTGTIKGWWINIGENGDYFQFRIRSNNGANIGQWKIDGGTINDNKWHHYSLQYNSDNVANKPVVYLDGELQNTYAIDTAPVGVIDTDAGIDFDIPYPGANSFDGQIANVAMWSDIRTENEVIEEFKNGYVDESAGNLISYWPFDGNYNDSVGSNNGTNNGTTMVSAIDGPLGNSPTQATLDLGAISASEPIYIRAFTQNDQVENTMGYDEWTITYETAGGDVATNSIFFGMVF